MQPSLSPPHPQQAQDADHLRLLAIFHYILAGLVALGAAATVVQIVIMNRAFGEMQAMTGEFASLSTSDPMGMITAIAWLICVVMVAGGILHFLCARYLTDRRQRSFCFVVACLSCLNIPLGLILGVFTIVVLQRPSVRELFDRRGTLYR